jgi:hypothetical protein
MYARLPFHLGRPGRGRNPASRSKFLRPFRFHCPDLPLSAIVGPRPIGFCAGLEIATFRRSMVGGASSDYE